MANLRSMFSGVDDEVIAMLLQSNNGHLERTVEQLLGITGGAVDVSGPAVAPANNLSVPGGGGSRRRSSNSERQPSCQPKAIHPLTADLHSLRAATHRLLTSYPSVLHCCE